MNGLLVPVDDADALARALDEIGSRPDLRAKMSAASVRLARERFDELQIVRTVLDTYAAVAARKGVDLTARKSAGCSR
jgi:glycosyltransferase involved in cell wall biosynthesis